MNKDCLRDYKAQHIKDQKRQSNRFGENIKETVCYVVLNPNSLQHRENNNGGHFHKISSKSVLPFDSHSSTPSTGRFILHSNYDGVAFQISSSSVSPPSLTLNRLYSSTHHCSPTEEEIHSASIDIIRSLPDIKSPIDIITATLEGNPRLDCFPNSIDHVRVASKVLDVFSTFPQIDPIEVFSDRLMMRGILLLSEDFKVFTRDQVTLKVLEIVRISPNVNPSKVTEDTHFKRDLGLDIHGCEQIVIGLKMTFRIFISDEDAFEFDSVKYSVDYICEHLHESWSPLQDANTGMMHHDYFSNLLNFAKSIGIKFP